MNLGNWDAIEIPPSRKSFSDLGISSIWNFFVSSAFSYSPVSATECPFLPNIMNAGYRLVFLQ